MDVGCIAIKFEPRILPSYKSQLSGSLAKWCLTRKCVFIGSAILNPTIVFHLSFFPRKCKENGSQQKKLLVANILICLTYYFWGGIFYFVLSKKKRGNLSLSLYRLYSNTDGKCCILLFVLAWSLGHCAI